MRSLPERAPAGASLRTRLTELLGIEHPVVQGRMMWVGRADLAAAVSEAGGLGIVTALTQPTPADLGREIERTRKLTDKPFGVNLTILPTITPPPYDEYRRTIVDSGVTIVETAGSSPEPHMEFFAGHGVQVIHRCTSVRHAVTAERLGVAAVSIDGFECAGHPGEDDIPGLILIPAAADALSIPVIASGGFCDGRGLAAALMLGADGVNMGTRFLCSTEAPVAEPVKRRIVEAGELDTDLVFRELRNTARVARNSVSDKVVRILADGVTFPDVQHLVAGVRGRRVFEDGDLETGIWSVGLSQGLVRDIAPAGDLVERIVNEAHDLIGRVFELFADAERAQGQTVVPRTSGVQGLSRRSTRPPSGRVVRFRDTSGLHACSSGHGMRTAAHNLLPDHGKALICWISAIR
ncbi:nitronate monooxygenase [Streptomyces sp. NPDC002764]|uniref:NAD(P)H-dependent flavin oxidoreductase n=1 Tax=Streptomyces sp. NPDC002764 TaxID=3154428 RepID=UPI00331B5559